MRKLLLFFFILLPILVSANFIGMNHGARAMSMGNAYIALADEPTAIFFNPAGIAKTENFYLKASHENLYGVSDLYSNMLAIIAPFQYTRAGLGITQVALLDEYSETVLYLSAASVIRPMGVPIYFGSSLKYEQVLARYINLRYTANLDLNAGIIVEAGEDIALAFTADNILTPEFKLWSEGDKLLTEYKTGVCYNWRKSVNFLADYVWNDDDSYWNLGGEMWFYDVFAARLGMNDDKLTTGFGIKHRYFTIDGALLSHTSLGSTYRISVGVKLGGKK
jgi:hypothetical protein